MIHKHTLFQKLFFIAPSLLLLFSSNAQTLQTTDAASGPYTPQSLINNVFLGDGVTVTNVTYNGNPQAVGYFTGGATNIGIDRGILLTTGFAGKPTIGFGPMATGNFFATNTNNSTATEPNLANIATAVLKDVAVYTITFIPTSDTLRFRYCFASEEYPEYSCTAYNDIFGFFIQGPGYPTPTNIAKVPGTNLPVAINNIHPYNDQHNPSPNPCQPLNIQYYNYNELTFAQPVYDGYTDVFTAQAVVTPCQTYTITLAIADVKDPAYDSGVFLEARSFGTTVLRAQISGTGPDGAIAEGCSPATLTLSLSDPLPNNYPIDLKLFGTATGGSDFLNLPANLSIPAGQTQISIPITAVEDNITESTETIAFDVKTDACHRDTVYLRIKDKILTPPLMRDTSVCTPGVPIQLNATIAAPTGVAPTFSNMQDFVVPDNQPSGISSTINVTGVQHPELGPGVLRSVCVNVTHTDDGDLDLYLVSPGGQVLELSTDNGGTGDNYTNTCFTWNAAQSISFPGPQAPATAAPFTGNFKPEGAWSDLWTGNNIPSNGNWTLKVSDDNVNSTGVVKDWSMTFAPLYDVTYQWASNPNITCSSCATNVVQPNASSTYTVTVTDIYGCTATDDVFVGITPFVATASVTTPINCFGQASGVAQVNVNVGGTNTYHWSDPAGQTSAQATQLSVGTYTVTVTNIGGCTATSSVTLTQPTALSLQNTAQNALCFGQANGSATSQIQGGSTPYQYLWSNGQTTANLQSIPAGAYTLIVTDANSCTITGSVTVQQPNAIALNVGTIQQVSCFGFSDGALSLNSSGGTAPLNYAWSNGMSGANISGLNAGNYTATLTDANGCSSTVTQSITQPTQVTAFVNTENVRCFGDATGALHLDANGGSPGYTSSWQGPGGFSGSGVNLENLIAGNYSVTVTDQKGCTSTATAALSEPADLILDLPATSDTICYDASNGQATVVAQGGVGPYGYLWDVPGQTGATLSGVSTQQYHVTVTDANGCTEIASTIIPQKQELNAFAQLTLPRCHDGADGSATVLSIYYGVTPANTANFTYLWNTSPVQHNVTAQLLKADQGYTVTVTDKDGCTAQYSFTMGNPILLEPSITGNGPVKCHGEASGWAAAGATGGRSPYNWQWSAGNNPQDSLVTGLPAGTTLVSITDANGCTEVSSVTLAEPAAIQINIAAGHVKCFGDRSGSALATAAGGNAPYQFIWDNGDKLAQTKELPAGTFTVTTTDANGCTELKSVEIKQPDAPISATVEIQEPRCHGGHDGRILFTAEGGTPPYRYGLDNQPVNGSPVQIGLTAGIYAPKVVDGAGCTLALSPIEVTQREALLVDLGPDIQIVYGQDTQLLAQVSNYIGAYQLIWSAADSVWLSCMDCINPSVYNLEQNHTFSVLVIDSLGCRAEDDVTVALERPRKVYVPTGFSPNGDFNNDKLLVHGQSTSKALSFRVYDRWGEMVYEAKNFAFNDENTGWDGTFRGQQMDPGVYVWVLEVEYVDGEKALYKGNTTLIR